MGIDGRQSGFSTHYGSKPGVSVVGLTALAAGVGQRRNSTVAERLFALKYLVP